METEPPAKVRVDRTPTAKVQQAPEAVAATYVQDWVRAAEKTRRAHRDEPLSRRLRAVARLLAEPALRAPAALARLAPTHPAVRLARALGTLRAAIELRELAVTLHATDEWGEWRAGRAEEARTALQVCAGVRANLTDAAEGMLMDPNSTVGLVEPVAGIARTLRDLVAGE